MSPHRMLRRCVYLLRAHYQGMHMIRFSARPFVAVALLLPACSHGRSGAPAAPRPDRKSTRLNSSHLVISYAVFCLKKKKKPLSCHPLTRLSSRPSTSPHTMPDSNREPNLSFASHGASSARHPTAQVSHGSDVASSK